MEKATKMLWRLGDVHDFRWKKSTADDGVVAMAND